MQKKEKDLDVNGQHFVVQKSDTTNNRSHQKTLQKYQTSVMFNDSVFVVAQLQMLKTRLLGVAWQRVSVRGLYKERRQESRATLESEATKIQSSIVPVLF